MTGKGSHYFGDFTMNFQKTQELYLIKIANVRMVGTNLFLSVDKAAGTNPF